MAIVVIFVLPGNQKNKDTQNPTNTTKITQFANTLPQTYDNKAYSINSFVDGHFSVTIYKQPVDKYERAAREKISGMVGSEAIYDVDISISRSAFPDSAGSPAI